MKLIVNANIRTRWPRRNTAFFGDGVGIGQASTREIAVAGQP